MRISKESLQARINNVSKASGVHPNVLYSAYFFDCFLLRLTLSRYAENFVLKGGFYLSSVLGLEHRYTEDIDSLPESNTIS